MNQYPHPSISLLSKLPFLYALFLFLAFTIEIGGQTLDASFNPYATVSKGTIVYAITQQADGKFLVGGLFGSSNGFDAGGLVRFTADGLYDQTFAGQVGAATTILVQNDGKIIVAGTAVRATTGSFSRKGLVRLNSDGTVDQSFSNSGGSLSITRASIQFDGKVVVGGNFTNIDGIKRLRLARFNQDGSLDLSFAPTPAGEVNAVYALPDGKIMVGGSFEFVNGVNRKNLVRLNYDGSVDQSYTIQSDIAVKVIKSQSDGRFFVGPFSYRNTGMPSGSAVRFTADANIDPSFLPEIWPGYPSTGTLSIEPQSDGKVLVGGNYDDLMTTGMERGAYRMNADGSIDNSFSPLPECVVMAISAQPNGNVLAGGTRPGEDISSRNLFGRFDSHGTPDPSFASTLGDATQVNIVATSPDGKTYVGGAFTEFNGKDRKRVVRLNRNGTIDSSFNVSVPSGRVYDLALQADGKVIIVGDFGLVNGVARRNLARLNLDGSVDETFQIGEGADGTINDIALQNDGKVLIGGIFAYYDNHRRYAIARINSDGSIDNTFDIGANEPSNGVITILPMPDGKIVIGGTFNLLSSVIVGNVARLNSDGSRDQTFNQGGGGAANGIMGVHLINGISQLPNGQILIGGTFTTFNGVPKTGLARLNVDGTLDNTYSVAIQNVTDIKMQPDGKALVGGNFSNIGGNPLRYLVRLNPDGTIDGEFHTGLGPDDSVYSIEIGPRGEILISGQFRRFDGSSHLGIARLVSNLYASTVWCDYDGDGKSDVSVFRPSTGAWYLNRSTAGIYGLTWGFSTDVITPADYDGDGKTDVAIFRPSEGRWYIFNSATSTVTTSLWGAATDVPAPADYDGDGKADISIFRPSDGNWWLNRSTAGTTTIPYGQNGDIPAVGDYDGDGKADVAIFRPSNGVWSIHKSSGGDTGYQFGFGTDKITQADYDGDGKTDIAIYRPSTGQWFIANSATVTFPVISFGNATDIPAVGDYDGDGKADVAIFRPSDGNWWLNRSTAGVTVTQFGQNGDKPTQNAYGN